MTKVFGFVAEFNPFHNGHKIFIDEIRKKYHPDVLIAIMSGNYVQRGDFAVLDKWKRSAIAVDMGVDLVVELPFYGAVQPANIFAETSIELLHHLGVTDLVFGTEERIDMNMLSHQLIADKIEFKQNFNQSYADNLNQELESQGISLREKPNKLLGVQYITSIISRSYMIDVHQIIRNPSRFSATYIRKNIGSENGLSIDKLVPEKTLLSLMNTPILTWNDFYFFLRYKILTNSTNDLQLVYQMVEGLEYKIKKEMPTSKTFDEFLMSVKSKRYTLARLRRLAMYTLMNVNDKEITDSQADLYIHVLAFNITGQRYLNKYKKNIEIPLITKVGKTESDLMKIELKADAVRKLVNGQEQNFGVIPYIKGDN
ncbi:nucleotidyltransferase family protein [Companilactobacillus ginsenosidimutans]|uniref:tRNA(Met) cytidine acetate ligase n=1 Tax=Companilactobacillus ginsenosidimutans TaxID=1007676 RepID=A0A0H4QJ98_9LACO|nr:nucleotidyltransferase family protein [Companilactobacillus ginsenosidimutans]AKP66753.1 hypothetical protein ABM34_03685 [Companilactobacillus ginsenosidimutans]